MQSQTTSLSETASVIEIHKPSPPAIVAELSPTVAAARAFKVIDLKSSVIAKERCKALRAGEKRIDEHFEKAKKAAAAAHKEIVAAVDALVGPIMEARRIYERADTEYEREQHRKAEEERQRLAEQARREEEDRQLAAAQEAQDRGDVAGAEEIVSQPVEPARIHVVPAVVKVDDVSGQIRWSAQIHAKTCRDYSVQEGPCRCYDDGLIELVQHVAAHPEHLYLLAPVMPKLNALATAQRNRLSIPGTRAVQRSVRSYR